MQDDQTQIRAWLKTASGRWPHTSDGARQPLGVKLSWRSKPCHVERQFEAVSSCLAKHFSPRSCQGQGRQAIVESRPPPPSPQPATECHVCSPGPPGSQTHARGSMPPLPTACDKVCRSSQGAGQSYVRAVQCGGCLGDASTSTEDPTVFPAGPHCRRPWRRLRGSGRPPPPLKSTTWRRLGSVSHAPPAEPTARTRMFGRSTCDNCARQPLCPPWIATGSGRRSRRGAPVAGEHGHGQLALCWAGTLGVMMVFIVLGPRRAEPGAGAQE